MTKAAEENKTPPTQEAPGSADATTPPPGAPVSTTPADAGPPRPGKRLPRVESLTGLRWWAAFFVFCHHMTQLAPLPIFKFLQYGTSGVTFFFVLSGFVLTWSSRPGTKISTFYRRRFARIFPLYFLTLVAAIFVFYRFEPPTGMAWIKPVSMTVLVLSGLLLQGWSNDPTILYGGNPAGWTLSVEAFFYAYFPFVWRATQRLKTAGGLILCVVGDRARRGVPPGAVPLQGRRTGAAAAGAALGGFPVRYRPRDLAAVRLEAADPGVVRVPGHRRRPVPALLLRCARENVPGAITMGLCQKEILTFLYGFLILAVAARDMRGGRSVLRSKPMVALGQWSYAFYLVHATILYAIKEQHGVAGPIGWSNLTWYAGVLVLSIFASALLYKLVEHPLERKLRGPR